MVLIVDVVAGGEPDFVQRQIDESSASVDEVAPDDPSELLSDEAKQRLADRRDTDAHHRDLFADVRDTNAEVRDYNAGLRDDRVSEQASSTDSQRRAAHDRAAASRDRLSAHDDRQHARQDREVSRWDRSVAVQVETQLLAALKAADDVAEATLLIGQAQGLLMKTPDVSARKALIELEQRAARDQVGLLEAARRIIAERPTADG